MKSTDSKFLLFQQDDKDLSDLIKSGLWCVVVFLSSWLVAMKKTSKSSGCWRRLQKFWLQFNSYSIVLSGHWLIDSDHVIIKNLLLFCSWWSYCTASICFDLFYIMKIELEADCGTFWRCNHFEKYFTIETLSRYLLYIYIYIYKRLEN